MKLNIKKQLNVIIRHCTVTDTVDQRNLTEIFCIVVAHKLRAKKRVTKKPKFVHLILFAFFCSLDAVYKSVKICSKLKKKIEITIIADANSTFTAKIHAK